MPINVDGIWLTTAAHRLINGEPYLLSAYETNPPSAVILYMPAALLMNLGLSLKQGLTIYGITLITSLLGVFYYYLKRTFPDNFTHYVFIFFSAFILVIQDYFSFERDLIIGLLLLPFLLNEFHSYNKKIQNSEYVFPVILMSIGCLIKPHYSIIPLVYYIYRFYKKRTLTLPHVLIPSTMIAATILLYIFAFDGFFQIIFPDIIDIYIGLNLVTSYKYLYLYSAVFLALSAYSIWINFKSLKSKTAVSFFTWNAFLFFIVFLLQNKGLNYHIFIAYALICTAVFIGFCRFFSPFLGLLILTMVCLFKFQMDNVFIKEEVVAKRSIGKHIHKNYSANNFYVLYDNLDYSQNIHAFTKFENASRYPSLWCYALFVSDHIDNKNFEQNRKKCISQVLEDFQYREPEYIIVPYMDKRENGNAFLNQARKNTDFESVFKRNYNHIERYSPSRLFSSFSYEENDWIKNKMHFDIYQKKATATFD